MIKDKHITSMNETIHYFVDADQVELCCQDAVNKTKCKAVGLISFEFNRFQQFGNEYNYDLERMIKILITKVKRIKP